jgi:phage anti-repressor protein
MLAEYKELSSDMMSEIQDPYIKKAFECASNNIVGMTVKEFIKAVDYPIDEFMVDNFFHNLSEEIPIYVTNELIEWCGFNVKEFSLKKRAFDRMLDNFDEGKDYFKHTNTEYDGYYKNFICQFWHIENTPQFPKPSEFKGKNKTKHLILTIDCFKQILMMLNTKKAKDIRVYYLALERLIKIYMRYQMYQQKYQNQILQIANKELIEKLDKNTKLLEEMRGEQEVQTDALNEVVEKLDKATYERAPKTKSLAKQGRFIIAEIKSPESSWTHYVIRAQQTTAVKAFDKIKDKYPNAVKALDITYQPNSVNLFNLIKEELRKANKVKVSGNYIKLLGKYTAEEFIEDVKRIDDERRDI